ncbi:DUF2489 domain-containing protein [Shewanella maritima]|uniref:DUF2489 domain-containing protein n=1 Tax=Shewanella maritima TaxID=2520507 RepID=UPI003735C4E6
MSPAVIAIAVIIVIVLATYAAHLLIKLKKQNLTQQLAAVERERLAQEKREAVLTDIRYIANAMLEERCELSEGVMRIGKLFAALSLTEQVQPQYPNLFEHYELIADHPIKEARKALAKQQRMKLDLQRMKSETKLEQGIMDEIKLISEFSWPVTH